VDRCPRYFAHPDRGATYSYIAGEIACKWPSPYVQVNAPYMTDPTLDYQTTRFTSQSLGIYHVANGKVNWCVYVTMESSRSTRNVLL
jgi:hypothetical protein